jgi:hypothetical protein
MQTRHMYSIVKGMPAARPSQGPEQLHASLQAEYICQASASKHVPNKEAKLKLCVKQRRGHVARVRYVSEGTSRYVMTPNA